MKKHAIFLATALVFLGINFYLYTSNLSLERDIAAFQISCAEKLAQLQGQKPTAVNYLSSSEENKNVSSPASSVPAGPLPRVNLENLVSYRHRVQAVTNKYEFLLESAQVDEADKKLLRRLLTRRETIANAIAFAEHDPNADLFELDEKLYEIEDQIATVLTDTLDYQRFEFLSERSL